MRLGDYAPYFANKLVIAGIRLLARDKEAAFAKWSRRIREASLTRPTRTNFGATIECDLNDHIMSRIFYFGVWEPSVSATISQILRSGDLFVDVGANIGYDSLLASKRVGRHGRVIAIEAASSIYAQLKSNIERNNATNVRTVRAAVAKDAGRMALYGGDAWNQGRTSPLARDGLKEVEIVEALPLDEILTPEERGKVKLIKIDIEGGELSVLERLVETLDLYNPRMHIVVEMSEDASGQAKSLFQRLVSDRFTAFSIANDYSLVSYLETTAPVRPKPIHKLPPHQTDVLFAPLVKNG